MIKYRVAGVIVFLSLIEIINHTNKDAVYNLLTGKKSVIFARWVPPNNG
jgi:hypothetical protein